MSSQPNNNLAPPAAAAGSGRRGSYAAIAAQAAASASSPTSAAASVQSSPATKRVDPIVPIPAAGNSSKPTSQPTTPQQAPPLVPAAIIDPNSRQAKWAAHEAQRRASLSTQGAAAGGTGDKQQRNRSRNRSRDRSKSPHHRRPNGGRASVSNVNDEVVAIAGGARSVSPPSGAGSAQSNSPPHQYTAPQPPSPTSASALGMAWNGNAGAGHNRARRGSAAEILTAGAAYAGEFVDRTSGGGSPVPHGDANPTAFQTNQQARRPSGYLSAHAAELMNIAARKMASKEEERAAALAGMASGGGRSSSSGGGSEPGEIVDADMHGEEYDQFHTPTSGAGIQGRSRSKSISSYDPIHGRMREFQAPEDPGDLAAIWGRVQATHRASISGPGPSHNDPHVHHPGPQGYPPMPPMPHHQHPSMSVPGSAGPGSPASQMGMMPHRRSSTFSYATGAWGPGGEQSPPSYPGTVPPHMQQGGQGQQMPYTSLPSSPDRIDRLRASQRRFSVSPTMSTGDYDQVATQVTRYAYFLFFSTRFSALELDTMPDQEPFQCRIVAPCPWTTCRPVVTRLLVPINRPAAASLTPLRRCRSSPTKVPVLAATTT
ncbi:hypothetical protein BCR44DRAFT_1172052 [Catenaria anguillulae PL171]|uniref:Uncharacterized protein n=1 Tax=Catenaria anguillulae PL171 TaxID=765915 RepID=A0A1Y2I0B3_9FUNG|nr:hypothetical protein BCR44DRAFT_1172052 [Catenaria anguillulae PL171]